jgi:hypothetical protein
VDTLDGLRLQCDRLDAAAARIVDPQDKMSVRLALAAARYTISEGVTAVHAFDAANVSTNGASPPAANSKPSRKRLAIAR